MVGALCLGRSFLGHLLVPSPFSLPFAPSLRGPSLHRLLLPCKPPCSFLLSPVSSSIAPSLPILLDVPSLFYYPFAPSLPVHLALCPFLPLMASSLLRRRRCVSKRQVSHKGTNTHRNHHLSVVCHEQQPIPSASIHPPTFGKTER